MGAGAGGLIGGLRELDPEEDRLAAILRSAATGGALGAGAGLGFGGGLSALSRAGRESVQHMGRHGVPDPETFAKILAETGGEPAKMMLTGFGSLAGIPAGGTLGYQLAKRRPEEDAEEIRP